MIAVLLEKSKSSFHPHVDFKGASFLFGAILFLMLGLNRLAQNFSLLAVILLMVSFTFLGLFFQHEKKESNPILDIHLLRSRPFLAANLYNLIFGAGVMGIFSFIPLYATSVYKLSTLVSGMILTPRSLAIIPASTVTSFLLRRWGYRWPMLYGLIIISFSTILLGEPVVPLFRVMGIHLGVTGILALLIMITGIGMGIALPASNNACIELMPEKVATITGLRGMFRSVGGALGISFITIILHLSSTPAKGFRAVFITFGLGLLCSIPLVFLMPDGKNVSFGPKRKL
jgi:Na+/melibiose symporter-like transporter